MIDALFSTHTHTYSVQHVLKHKTQTASFGNSRFSVLFRLRFPVRSMHFVTVRWALNTQGRSVRATCSRYIREVYAGASLFAHRIYWRNRGIRVWQFSRHNRQSCVGDLQRCCWYLPKKHRCALIRCKTLANCLVNQPFWVTISRQHAFKVKFIHNKI